MATERVTIDYTTRRYIAFIATLLIALLALLFLYFALTKPPISTTAKKQEEFRHLFSIYGFEGDLLRRPSGVALDVQGRIFIADTGKQRVVVFDQEGTYITQFGNPGTGKYEFKDPIAVTVSEDGRVFVLSKTSKKIIIYNGNFEPTHEMRFSNDEPPLSMTVHKERLYVTTIGGIMIGDLQGNLISTLGKRGMAPGEFQLPGGIVIGDDDIIYVADSLNYRVQALSKEGEPLWQYGQPLPPDKAITYQGKDRKFGLPASIALDDNGHLYVVDGLSSEIALLNTKGERLDTIGDIGHDDGFFYYPAGVAYAGSGKLVLADKYNDRVQVFQVPIATSPSVRVFAWAPYLLVLLIPLLLWLLTRSRLQVIASEDFLQRAIAGDSGQGLASAFKRLVVPPQTVERMHDVIPQALRLNERAISERELQALPMLSELTGEQASGLALAHSIKGKRLLLTESPVLRKAAGELGIATMNYAEFSTAYGTR